MAIDFTTALGKVRLYTADLDEAAPLIGDDVLTGFLALHGDEPLLAAAEALEAMATSEVLVARKIRTQDLSTDGPAVAAELRRRAADLRARFEAENTDFTIVPFCADGPEGVEARL